MVWTDPRDFVVGEMADADLLNTYLRDNMNATEAGVVTAAGDLVYATGAGAVTRLAIGSNGQYLGVSGGVPAWVAAPTIDAALLGRTSYDPGTVTTYTISSATLADVDATNLSLGFTAPASGNVLVVLSAFATEPGTASQLAYWGLRAGTNDVAGSIAAVIRSDTSAWPGRRPTYRIPFTGLSGAYTWKWASACSSGSFTFDAGGDSGAAVMEAWALP
jgi:hypothetical protein